MTNTARIDPANPPYVDLRDLLKAAYEPDQLARIWQHEPFGPLKFRFSRGGGMDGTIDAVFGLCRTQLLWEELLDRVAADAPGVYNRLAAKNDWPRIDEPVIAVTDETEPIAHRAPLPTRADVEIHVTERSGEGFRAYIETSLTGDGAGILVPAWAAHEMQRRILELEIGTMDRNGLMSLGTQLFGALFADDVRDNYFEARGRSDEGLRLRLRLDPPELQALPWELLYNDRHQEFVALAGQALVTRYLAVPRGRPPLTVAPPLRILLVTASPRGHVQLDVEAEVAAIEGVLQDMETAGEVRIHVLRHAQRMTLRNTLRDFGPHVLHFIGHGRADREGGALVLEKPDGGGDLLSGSMLSTLLKRTAVRLAVLNACLTARGAVIEEEDFYKVRRALLGVGPALVDAGLGAVVAMQFSMRDLSARVFAEDFYTTLARLEPVDEAVSRAREALMLQFGEDQRDWATPVLFLRAPDGVIFR